MVRGESEDGMIEKREFYIGGGWVAPLEGTDFEVIDPSTEAPCATISLGSPADVDAAVAAATAALPAWRDTAPAERRACVARLLEVYRARRAELGPVISLEMGTPIDLALSDQAEAAIGPMEAFLEAFDQIAFEEPLSPGAGDTAILREAVGVVGLITPWNRPMRQIVLKVVAALLAGCTMVLKPSEVAPLSAMLFAEMLDEAGLPPGVFNLVNGDGEGAGAALSAHPGVAMISFTGSAEAGIAISRVAAATLKKVSLELGGKGANIIFADADAAAVERGVRHCFANSGQACNAPTRMLVERPLYAEAVRLATAIAEAMPVASAHEPGQHLGPLVSAAQYHHVQELIGRGIEEGARLVAGGLGRPRGLEHGYFVQPTIFADVAPGMAIEQTEIFGPVLCLMPFDTEEEAVAIANGTPYGLTNYVQTADPERARRVARQLRSGVVEMNGRRRAAASFFGGVKCSGHAREGGRWGIEEFLVTKSVSGWFA